MSTKLCTLALALCLTGLTPTQADTLYVDDDAPNDPGPGTPTLSDPLEDGSPDHPFDSVQKAINAATNGDEILLADGLYTGPGNRNIDFSEGLPEGETRAITVRSENGPTDCIIDCEQSGRGFHFHTGEGPASVIQGLTIQGGYVDAYWAPDGCGGGILCESSSPTITFCNVSDNTSGFSGGGISCLYESNALIQECTISNNTGGGFCCAYECSPIIRDCTIAANTGCGIGSSNNCILTVSDSIITENRVQGVMISGGGICSIGTTLLMNCEITRNTSEWSAGGLYLGSGKHTLVGCTIADNHADDQEGGVGCYGDATLLNCLITRNSTGGSCGGIATGTQDNPVITNCTITRNVARRIGGLSCGTDSHPRITNCIIRDNTLPNIDPGNGDPLITYSNIQGGWDGEGNIDADPEFAFDGDYHLLPDSPCIDTGTNEPEGGLPPSDLDGNERALDGDGDTLPSVDMGVYEFNPISPSIAVSASTLEFVIPADEPNPAGQTLGIRNCGGAVLNWEIHEDCPWLEVAPTAGSSQGEVNEPLLTADPVALAPGEYETILTITAPDAVNSPLTVCLRLYVCNTHRVPSEYATIQDAIDASETRDIVLVADGTYTGPGNRDIDFCGKAITVRSENGPGKCIIDCEQSGRGFYFHNRETRDSILQGFTITGGLVDTESLGYPGGGAVHCGEFCSPTIQDCAIIKNSAADGGGIFCDRGSNAAILQCVIAGNIGEWSGGGLSFESSSQATIADCTITGNSTENDGGGVYCHGSAANLLRCSITRNTSGFFGGGVCCRGHNQVMIADCLVSDNIAQDNGGGISAVLGPGATITNCTITRNIAYRVGGGVGAGKTTRIANSIVWDNQPFSIYCTSSTSKPEITHSNIEGGWEGEGNISVDPRFACPGDYHLTAGSSCIDTGTNSPPSALEQIDLDGNPRLQDGDADTVAVVDMGAFEFNPDRPLIALLPGDIEFSIPQGESNPIQKTLEIRNGGSGLLNWEISEACSWLEVAPLTGTTDADGSEVILSAIATAFPVGEYRAVLTISSPDAVNSPCEVPVILYRNTIRKVPGDYATIQAAIDAADPHDVVLLEDGIYTGPGNRDLDYLGKPITVQSENGPETCIIDCEGEGRGVSIGNGGDQVLQGLTIRNGHASAAGGITCYNGNSTITQCIIENCIADTLGGGITCSGSLTLTDCIIAGNNAGTHGGGLYFAEGSSPRLAGCIIENNTAGDDGGGLYAAKKACTFITDCTIHGNSAESDGGGILVPDYSDARITRCSLCENTAGNYGGAIIAGVDSVLVIRSASFQGNAARYGGAFNGNHSFPEFTACLFTNNVATGSTGGAIRCWYGFPTITGCTITGNVAEYGPYGAGAAIESSYDGLIVTNSIVWGNEPRDVYLYAYSSEITHSCLGIYDVHPEPGAGTIFSDPLFIDPDGPDDDPATWQDNDFRLRPGSPCIDAASNLAVPLDYDDQDADGDLTERIPFDFAGRPRFIDDPEAPDTGIADLPVYPEIADIGAYEFQPGEWLPGDLNCDNELTAADIEPFILALLDPAAYATAFPDCNRARADLNADAAVNGLDIAVFVRNLLHPE